MPEETNGTTLDDGSLEWIVPLDGSIAEWRAQSLQAPANNAWWARPLSIAALVFLVAWVVFMIFFIGYVAWARSRRSRRYRQTPPPPTQPDLRPPQSSFASGFLRGPSPEIPTQTMVWEAGGMGTSPERPVISRVDFHFDVMCPFAYQTAKWIRDVRAQNGLEISWRFFSLEEINRVEGKKHPWEREWSYGWSMMRIGALLRRTSMDDLDRWYERAGRALHEDGHKPHEPTVARHLLEEIGLDPADRRRGDRRSRRPATR